jgi:hypothetical protein
MQPEPAPARRTQAEFSFSCVAAGDGRLLSAPGTGTRGTRRVLAALAPADPDIVVACVPRRAANLAFLALPGCEPIEVEGDGMSGPMVSFRLMRVPETNLFELRHPVARMRRLGVAPHVPGRPSCRILFDRVGDPVRDRFNLPPLDASRLQPAIRCMVEEVLRVLGPPIDADELIAAVENGSLRSEVVESVLRLLAPDQLEALARRVLRSPPLLRLLQNAMPHDRWLAAGLPALITWQCHGRPACRECVSSADETHVVVPYDGDVRPQAGLLLHTLARKTVSARRMAALLVTVKNEGPYLLDWISYHRAIGFEHIFIYANDNSDGSDELLHLLAQAGVITWIRNEVAAGQSPQLKAYAHAFRLLPDLLDYRWTMILDADEYFGLNADMFDTVHDYIAWHEHLRVDAVALRWVTFAGRPGDVWNTASSTRRFVWRAPQVGPLFKSMCRTNMFAGAHAHFPYPVADAPFIYRWEDGTMCYHMAQLEGKTIAEPPPTARLAWVAHYVFRSANEALLKMLRGDAWHKPGDRAAEDRMERILGDFVSLATNPGLVRDDRILRFAARHDIEHSRLESLPGIAECNAHLQAEFGARLPRVAAEALAAVSTADSTRAGAQFCRMLQMQ